MISTIDLSSVTDRIIQILDDAVTTWPGWIDNGGTVARFTIQNSSMMPETVRASGDCQVTFYLFHAQPDPFVRNAPPTGNVAQRNTSQPFGLTLYYLLSAYAKGSSTQEQQALSIAFRALHERATYHDPIDAFTFTITHEAEKAEDANRRWQSFTAPFRLSTVYRVGAVFITPTVVSPKPAAPPSRIGLSLAPAALPFSTAGALTATASRVDLSPLNPQPTDPIHYDYTPAVVRPGERFATFGTGLDATTSQRLYLIDAAMAEFEITPWRAPAAQQTASRLVATLPATIGPLPGNSPQPGLYQLRVGSSIAAGDGRDYRSNATPISIAARTNAPPLPWNGPPFSFTGAGFLAGETELYLDTLKLTQTGGAAPGDGEFSMNAAGTSITFSPPAGALPGPYYVRLRVRGVEGPAVGRIVLP